MIGTTHVFEFKSGTYYHFGTYESFNCGRVITVQEEVKGTRYEETTPPGSNKSVASSSTQKLEQVGYFETPAKTCAATKRKLFFEDEDTEVGTSTAVEASLEIHQPMKKKRVLVVQSDSDNEDGGAGKNDTSGDT